MAENGDAQAAPPGAGSRGARRESARQGQVEAAEEGRARQVAAVDRGAALTAHLEREAERGFSVETRSATQAVIVRSGRRFRLPRTRRGERLVLSVDEHGNVVTRAAEPVRW